MSLWKRFSHYRIFHKALDSFFFDSCVFSCGLILFFLRDSEFYKLLEDISLLYFVDLMHNTMWYTFYRLVYFYKFNLVCHDLSFCDDGVVVCSGFCDAFNISCVLF